MSAAAISDAVDRLDKLLEQLYVGSEEFTVQNYQAMGTWMEVIRAGLQKEAKK